MEGWVLLGTKELLEIPVHPVFIPTCPIATFGGKGGTGIETITGGSNKPEPILYVNACPQD